MKIPYVCIEVTLFNCCEDPEQLRKELKEWLKNKLETDYKSDIDVDIIETVGWKND